MRGGGHVASTTCVGANPVIEEKGGLATGTVNLSLLPELKAPHSEHRVCGASIF